MYQASVENVGGSKNYATTRDSGFVIDTEGAGSNPVDAFLAGLCGCMAHELCEYLRLAGMPNSGFSIRAEGILATEGTYLSDIGVSIALKLNLLDEQRKKELLEYVQRCKLFNTLKRGTHIEAHLVEEVLV
ncbi:MAG: OsmC family protein [Nitrospiraceae bacterium]|jgi:uncharacterized OsmC-like protein|nr:OsmC family protein [Nitrospiraceae bacterium]